MAEASADARERAQAKQAAVKLLAQRDRPRGFLEQRLRQRGYAPAAISAALDALQAAGYIGDEQYARQRVEALLGRSKRGAHALQATLRAEGIAPELAQQVVAERLTHESEAAWAVQTARARLEQMGRVSPEVARRRLYGYLGRRGFRDSDILAALEEVLPTEP